jgi:hypothetical protein
VTGRGTTCARLYVPWRARKRSAITSPLSK